jgi:hypothetical protein
MAGQKLTLTIEVNGSSQTITNLKAIQKAIAGLSNEGGSNANTLGKGIAGLAFNFNEVTQAAQNLVGALRPAYDLLIGQNEQLNQQLLQSAASITATSRVFQGTELIKDPTASIKALQGPLLDAIKDVQKATMSLVGVTSEQTSSVFNTILSNIGQLNDQSKQFPDAIKSASALAPGLVATLGTLGLPLEQAGQEVRDLLQGTITSDSQVAKSLGITNQMVQNWRSQGVLVDELTKKFQPFVDANKLAARSVSGLTSNIQDIVEVTARSAGVPLQKLLVDQLEIVYNLLNENSGKIQDFATDVVNRIATALKTVVDAITQIAQTLTPVIQTLGSAFQDGFASGADAAQNVLQSLTTTIVSLVQISKPFLQVTASLVQGLAKLADTDIGRVLTEAAIATVGLNLAFGKMSVAFEVLVPAIGGLKAGLVATQAGMAAFTATSTAAGGGIVGLQAALAASIPSLQTFAASAAAAVAPLLPIIALGGAVAVTFLIKQTGDMKVASQEIEEFGKQADIAAQQTITLASKIKELQDKANKGTITPAERKQLQGYSGLLKQQSDANEELKQKILSVSAATPEQAQALKNLAQQLDTVSKAAKGAGDAASEALKIESPLADDLGGVDKQLKDKIENARKQLQAPKTNDEADQAAKTLIQLTQTQLEQGLISKEQAVANFREIASNAKTTYEQRIAAEQALTKVVEQRGAERLQSVKNEQSQIEQLVAKGRLTDAQGETQLSQLKVKESQVRLQNTQDELKKLEALGLGKSEKAVELRNQEKEQVAAIASAQNDAEKKLLAQRLKETQDSYDKANAAIAASTTQRETEIQKLVNSGAISEQQAEQLKTSAQRSELEKRLQQARQNVDQLKRLPIPNDPDERQAQEKRIRDAVQQTAALQLQLLQNEYQAQQQLRQIALQRIEDEKVSIEAQAASEQAATDQQKLALDGQVRSLEQQNQRRDISIKSLEQQSNLLGAQKGLQESINDLTKAELDIRQKNTQEALALVQKQEELQAKRDGVQVEAPDQSKVEDAQKDLNDQRLKQLGQFDKSQEQLAQDIYAQSISQGRLELNQLAQKQSIERATLELEIARNKAASDRAITEAKISELKAQQQQIDAQAAIDDAKRQQELAAIAKEEAQLETDPQKRDIALRRADIQAQQANTQLQRSQGQLDTASQGITVAQQAVTQAQQAATAQAQQDQIQRNTLYNQQQAQVDQAASDVQSSVFQSAQGVAEQGLQVQLRSPRFQAVVSDQEAAANAASQQADASQQTADTTQQTADATQQAADASQQQAKDSTQTQDAYKDMSSSLGSAANESGTIADNLERAASAAERVGAALGTTAGTTVPKRRQGGDVTGGQLYQVHKDELFVPGQDGYMLNRTDAMRVAQQAMTQGAMSLGGMPALGAIAPGNVALLGAISQLSSKLNGLQPGIQISNLQQSVVNQVPQNERAIARMVERSNIDLLYNLKNKISSSRIGKTNLN